MKEIIKCKKLKTSYRIDILESIKNVCGYDIKNIKNEFCFFSLTPYEIEGIDANLNKKMKALKQIIPILIEQMNDQNDCVMQLFGALNEGSSFPEIFPFIFSGQPNRRYYFPCYRRDWVDKGYQEAWFSFEFNKEKISELPLGFDIIIKGFITTPGFPNFYEDFYMKYWSENILKELLSKAIIYFETDIDLEFFSVASKIPMETIFKKWQEGLNLYDKE
jgi:hypothetical protein